MTNKTSWNMVWMMMVIMGVGFLMNFQVLLPIKGEEFIQRGWVKSINLWQAGSCYKLNVNQQGEMLYILNHSILQQDNPIVHTPRIDELPFDHIVIQRFAKEDIELFPAGTIGEDLVFVVMGREEKACLLKTNRSQLHHIAHSVIK